MILSIDTTGESGSVALCDGGHVADEIQFLAPGGFGHVLYQEIGALLGRNGAAPSDVDCFAAASGPGSFTGVRIGLAAVKGLAEALRKPAVAVSNLMALASLGTRARRAAIADARRGEVYAAVYDNALALVSPEVVTPLSEWLAALAPGADIEFVAMDFSPFAAVIAARFPTAPLTLAPRSLAGAIGRIAARELAAGRALDPAAIDANYVRRSDAELFWKE